MTYSINVYEKKIFFLKRRCGIIGLNLPIQEYQYTVKKKIVKANYPHKINAHRRIWLHKPAWATPEDMAKKYSNYRRRKELEMSRKKRCLKN